MSVVEISVSVTQARAWRPGGRNVRLLHDRLARRSEEPSRGRLNCSICRPTISGGGRVETLVISPAITTTTAPSSRICVRCESTMIVTYDELECLLCGYVDYTYTPPVKLRPKSILSTGTRYVLRYVGDSKSLSETLTYVKLQRLRNRVVFGVKCPFCEKQMDQSSLSGKRREVREERYKCESGHRVSLLPKKDGSMGWK